MIASKTWPPPFSFKVSPILRGLGGVIVALLVASFVVQLVRFVGGRPNVHGLVPMWDLDVEKNIPTYFSALLLLGASLLLLVVAATEKSAGRPTRAWYVLATGFFAMSAEEVLSFHERLNEPIKAVIGAERLGLFAFAWVIPGIAVVVFLGVCFIPFLMRLSKETRREFLLAAALFIGGAIGVELLAGRYSELHGNDNLIYCVHVIFEEGLEMFGVLFFIRALLRHIARRYSVVAFDFGTMKSVPLTKRPAAELVPEPTEASPVESPIAVR